IEYRPSSASKEKVESSPEASTRSRSSAVIWGTSTESTCWSKAISIRMRSMSLIADELCQNAAGRIRVDEPDLQAEHPAPRRFVDELDPVGLQPGELGADVGGLERDVMDARAAVREELADGRVLAERGEQLDAGAPDAQRRRLDSLVLNPLA